MNKDERQIFRNVFKTIFRRVGRQNLKNKHMISTQCVSQNDNSTNVIYDKNPDECPVCRKKITPGIHQKFLNFNNELQIIFRCPDERCKNIFISFYEYNINNGHYYFNISKPSTLAEKEFSEIIKSISTKFIKIYNQSHFAEQSSLDLVCGSGYRKALEFLIKDYLIKKDSTRTEIIKKKFLKNCIEDDVDDAKLKLVAERATWLGNDETHYERTWENKDLGDLKKLIDLTVHWIEMEELTKDLEKNMPNKKTEIKLEEKTNI